MAKRKDRKDEDEDVSESDEEEKKKKRPRSSASSSSSSASSSTSSASQAGPSAAVLAAVAAGTFPVVVEYSEKAVAVIGDSRPVKDTLKSIGGKWNAHLNVNGNKTMGWIFPKSSQSALVSFLESVKVGTAPPSSNTFSETGSGAASKPTATSTTRQTSSPATTTTAGKPSFIVDYSEKAIAVFGDSRPIKDQLKELGGRYNPALTWEGSKRPGWIFSKSKKEAVEKLIKSGASGSSEAGAGAGAGAGKGKEKEKKRKKASSSSSSSSSSSDDSDDGDDSDNQSGPGTD